MKKLIIIILAMFISACGTQMSKMNDYSEPADGKTAEIHPYGVLKGIGLDKTNLEVFSGCFSGNDYAKENVLGKRNFKKEKLGKEVLRVPAGERLYFKYGTDNPHWDCHAQFSFVPEQDEKYKFDYLMKFGGCHVYITKLGTNEPVDMQWYKKTDSEKLLQYDARDWRKCGSL